MERLSPSHHFLLLNNPAILSAGPLITACVAVAGLLVVNEAGADEDGQCAHGGLRCINYTSR